MAVSRVTLLDKTGAVIVSVIATLSRFSAHNVWPKLTIRYTDTRTTFSFRKGENLLVRFDDGREKVYRVKKCKSDTEWGGHGVIFSNDIRCVLVPVGRL